MSEADFQAAVIDLACRTGWQCHHQKVPYRTLPTGRKIAITEPGTTKGVPDLLLVHPHRGVLHVELKTEAGRLTAEQELWRDRLIAAGGDWRLWRPHDWESEIEPTLRGDVGAAGDAAEGKAG
jgi:hypothetical protein